MTSSLSASTLFSLLNSTESSPRFKQCLQASFNVTEAEVESFTYPDIKYNNLKDFGISFQFEPPSTEREAQDSEWRLVAVDLYSGNQEQEDDENKNKRKEKRPWKAFKCLPLKFSFVKDAGDSKSSLLSEMKELEISAATTGMELVAQLGEPDRKGGGSSGASKMGPAAWLEWNLMVPNHRKQDKADQRGTEMLKVKLMVELSGKDSRGSDRWEKGGNSNWGVMTIALNSSKT